MAKQTINLGTDELTGDGESIRSALTKVNENFTEVYADIAASGDYNDLTNKPTIPSFNQDLNSTDDVAFNTLSTPNLVLDGDVTTSNEIFIDGDAQAIGIRSLVSIVLDGDVNFQNGDLTVAGNIEVDGSFINNSVSDGSGLQVETTSDFEIKVDTAIWSFEPNDGGRIIFPDGSTQTTAYTGPQTTFDSDVDFNDIVKFAKTTTTGDDDNPTLTLIDVNSSSVQVLTSNSTTTNNWELPDGSEGQIMHFVAGGTGSGANHKIKINNWWKRDADTGGWSSVTGYWDVFAIYGFAGRADTGMATAIFVDGAWRTTSPWVD